MKYKVGDKVKIRKDLIVDAVVYGGLVIIPQMTRVAEENNYIMIVNKIVEKGYCLNGTGKYIWTDEMIEGLYEERNDDTNNNGGNTDYYRIPNGAEMIQDLIEYKNLNFSLGNILKACYRLGSCSHSDAERDLNKIIWFAQRELNRIKGDD
jgi:hypothetical protein